MLLSASSLSARALPLGLLTAGSTNLELPLVYSSSQCSTCGARGNAHCQLDTNRWCCVICSQWNALESNKTREFTYSAFATSFQEGSRARKSHHAFVVLDETLSTRERVAIRDSLTEAINGLPDDMYLGLIIFGGAVRIYELGSMGNRVSSEVFSGSTSPSNEDLREIALHENATSGLESFVAPIHVCRGVVFSVLNFLAEQPRNQSDGRCLGPAIEYALALSKICDASSTSIIVATEGAGTVGPGTWRVLHENASAEVKILVEQEQSKCLGYYGKLATAARETHSSLDVFVTGFESVSGLGVTPLLELTSNVFLRSMACRQTMNIALGGYSNPLNTFKVAISDPHRLSLVHSTAYLQSAEGKAVSFETRTKPSLFLDNRIGHSPRSENDPPIYIQCICKKEFGDREIVVTEKLTVARPFAVMNGEAIAVLVAKRSCIIAQSNRQDLLLARKHVENELYNVSRLVNEEILDQGEFEKMIVLLFHFYRGPLLGGPGSQYNEEEIEVLQARFLKNSSFEEAVLLMAPSLTGFRWGRLSSVRSGGNKELNKPSRPTSSSDLQPQWKRLPLSTMSLESDHCLVLDQLTDVFVWIGADVPRDAKERALAQSHATSIATQAGRYPVSRIIQFEEHSPKSRWLRCRLSPEHMEIGTNLSGSSDEARRLVSKLWNQPTDTLTFNVFMQTALGGSVARKTQGLTEPIGNGLRPSAEDRVYRML